MNASPFKMVGPKLGPLLAVTGFIAVGMLVLSGLFLSFIVLRPEAELDGKSLHFSHSMYGQTIAVSDLRVQDAKVVNLDSDGQYAPGTRENGMSVPGMQQGWFRLNNGEKALVFLTDRTKVLYVPSQQHALLFSAADPEGMLAALRKSP